jgi:hypothetical protein
MSRKLIFLLAGGPIAAQYGVYTLPRGYNSATVPRGPRV